MWYKARIKGCIILSFHYSHFSSAIFFFLSFKKHWSETSPRSETLSLHKNTRGNASKQQGFCSPETHIQEPELPSFLLHHPADEKVGRVAQENVPIVTAFRIRCAESFSQSPVMLASAHLMNCFQFWAKHFKKAKKSHVTIPRRVTTIINGMKINKLWVPRKLITSGRDGGSSLFWGLVKWKKR